MNTVQLTTPSSRIPVSRLDPYSDDALAEPWQTTPPCKTLGSAVWLTKNMRCLPSRDMTA